MCEVLGEQRGRGPEIRIDEDGDAPSGAPEAEVAGRGASAVGLRDVADRGPRSAGELRHSVRRPVRAAVVYHHDLVALGGKRLRSRRPDRLAQHLAVVVGWDDDADFHAASRSSKEVAREGGYVQLQVGRHVSKDAAQRAYFKTAVSRHGDVVGSTCCLRRQPHVAPGLASDSISSALKYSGQFLPAQVAGKLHTAISSSFTR